MTISVTHAFVSAIADDPAAAAAGEVVPSNWNAAHVVTGAVADSRQVLAGTGLTGGGALTSDVTLALSASTSATLGGALQSANNLSDVANAATARGNLAAAPLASPALTGTPTAPTAAQDTGTTQIASTAYVLGQAGTALPIVDGTAAAGSSTRWSRQDHVHPTDTSRAPLASPALTGTPTAPTAAAGTSTTQLATTAFVTGAIRQLLAGPVTYFVSPTGSDSNNGLTSGTPFLTIQHAYNVIAGTLDFGGQTVTIQLADGTYTAGLSISSAWAGGGALVLNGDATTPDNVVLSTSNYGIFNNSVNLPGPVTVQHMKITTTANDCIRNQGSGQINFNDIDFGASAGMHVAATSIGASCVATGNCRITGAPAGTVAFYAQSQAQVFIRGFKWTLGPARLTWSAGFAFATQASLIAANTVTFVGSQTVTMTIASPAVVSWTAHGLSAGDAVVFNTSGALPTGVTAGTTYYVLSAGLTANAFEFSTTVGGTAANTSGSQSGTHNAFGVNGVRYFADTNSVINTSGGGATFLPGTTTGSLATGGQYS
jgi:hypothetical protein